MFTDRVLLVLLLAAMAGTIMTGLALFDGVSWPKALILGLSTAGAVLVGTESILE